MAVTAPPANLTSYVPSFLPVSSVTPFTYRDGDTFLTILEGLRRYINKTIVPFINDNFESLGDQFAVEVNKVIDEVNTQLAGQKEYLDTTVADVLAKVDAAVQTIITNSIEANDPMVAQMFTNPDSQTRAAADPLYAPAALTGTVSSLGDTVANQASVLGTLTDTNLATRVGDPANPLGLAVISLLDPNVADLLPTDATSLTSQALTDFLTTRVSDLTRAGKNSQFLAGLPNFKAKIAALNAGTATADPKVLVIGDSTTYGTYTSYPNGYANEKSWPSNVANDFDKQIARCVMGLSTPYPSSGVAHDAGDSRFQLGTGWGNSTVDNTGLGGVKNAFQAAPTSGNLTFNDPRFTADMFDLYFLATTSANMGTVSANATGGSTVTKSMASQPARGIIKVTVQASAINSTNKVNVWNSAAAGTIYFLGVEPWRSDLKRVRVGNAGASGSTSSGWVAQAAGDTANGWNVLGFLPVYDPDLVIIDLGINDSATPLSTSDFMTNMTQLYTACKAAGADVLFKTFIPSNGRDAVQADYVTALRSGTVRYPVIDIYNHFGTWARANALGYMVNDLHGTDGNYAEQSKLVVGTLAPYLH